MTLHCQYCRAHAAALHLLHDRQLELFGGLRGVRDEGAIERSLARVLNAWNYGTATDIATLAATYLCALSRQRGYLDGNKRTALAAMLVFLGINGFRLEAPGPELYAIVMSATTGTLDVTEVAAWLRGHVEALQESAEEPRLGAKAPSSPY